jgi:hypothetical protein
MKKLMHFLFLSCLKATELIEKKIYFKLSVKEKLQLAAHKTMCSACTNYEKHSQMIDVALANSTEPQEVAADLDALKKEIAKTLQKPRESR